MNRGARVALTLFVALLLVPAIAWTIWNARAGAELRRALGAIEAKGWPTTIDSLRPPAVPDAENAAPLLNRALLQMAGGRLELQPLSPAFEALTRPWDGGTNFVDRLRTDASLAANVRVGLAAREVVEVLDLLHEASTRRACDFKLRYEEGPALRLPHVSPIRSAIRILCLKAWFEASGGDGRRALGTLRDAFAISGMMLDDGVLISLLVSSAGDRMLLDALPQILAPVPAGSIATADLDALAGDLSRRRLALRPAFVRAMDWERIVFGQWAFDAVLGGSRRGADLAAVLNPGGASGGTLALVFAHPLRPLFKSDCAFYLSLMSEMRGQAGQPFDPSVADRFSARVNSFPRWAILSRLITPSFGGIFMTIAETECALDVARVGLALERHRLAKGAYPASLEELQLPGGVPKDPFTGKPLVYKPSATGVLVYGFGKNARDDQGRRRSGTAGDYDIVWEMRR